MSKKWTPAKLNKRISVAKASLDPSSSGGFNRGYEVVATVWASLDPLSFRESNGMYVKDSQVNEKPTHTVLMRKDASVGVSFLGVNANLGSHRFLLFPSGPDSTRIFRIHNSSDLEERGVLVKLLVEEIEEQSSESLIS